MINFRTWKSDQWYCLTFIAPEQRGSGDIGRGGMETSMRFQTRQEREYFMQAANWRDRADLLAFTLQGLRESIEEAIKVRGIRKELKRLLEVYK